MFRTSLPVQCQNISIGTDPWVRDRLNTRDNDKKAVVEDSPTKFTVHNRSDIFCQHVRHSVHTRVVLIISGKTNVDNILRWFLSPNCSYRTHCHFPDIDHRVVLLTVPKPLQRTVHIRLPLGGSNVDLLLQASPRILDESFVLLVRDANSTTLLTDNGASSTRCFYRSQHASIRAAVDLCDGMVCFLVFPHPNQSTGNLRLAEQVRPLFGLYLGFR